MKMNSISGITCLVKDLQKTAAFYEALGFRLGKQNDDHLTCYVNWFWVDFIADSRITDDSLQEEAKRSHRGAGQYLYIKVENADEFYEGVLAKGMTPDGKPQRQPSGAREFALRDPDGYKLVFFEKK